MTDDDGPTPADTPPEHAGEMAGSDVLYADDDRGEWVALRTETVALVGTTENETVMRADEARKLARNLLVAAERVDPTQ
jgi:hypothetical protein